MHVTAMKSYDGYHECLVGFGPSLSPIFKCRAVLNSAGKFEPIVRTNAEGIMVASGTKAHDSAQDCMIEAIEKARKFLLLVATHEFEARILPKFVHTFDSLSKIHS